VEECCALAIVNAVFASGKVSTVSYVTIMMFVRGAEVAGGAITFSAAARTDR